MKKHSFWAMCILLLALTIPALSWVSISKSNLQRSNDTADSSSVEAVSAVYSKTMLFDNYISTVYQQAGLESSGLNPQVFRKALIGYYNFQKSQLISDARKVITIIDFTRKSTEKRLWIVDLATNRLLYNTIVAHGNGSGANMATSFSNIPNSNQSSLGFYVANETYFGKHGLSLRLDGMDKGFNTNARSRAVVVHGAEYVSDSFIRQNGRLGRSQGCPALPVEFTENIINTIKGKTCMFINGPADNYSSSFLNEELAVNNFAAAATTMNASL